MYFLGFSRIFAVFLDNPVYSMIFLLLLNPWYIAGRWYVVLLLMPQIGLKINGFLSQNGFLAISDKK